MFHAADVIRNLNRVPHYKLVFQNDVEPSDHVANQGLRSESQGQAGKAGKRYGWQDIDSEFIQRCQNGDSPDYLAPRAINNSGQRARLLFAELRLARLSRGRLND